MRQFLLLCVLSTAIVLVAVAQTHEAQFLTTYVDILGTQYALDKQATADMVETSNNATRQFIAIMKNAKRSTLELGANILSLGPFFNSPNRAISHLVSASIVCYQDLIDNNKQLDSVCQVMLSLPTTPNDRVNVGKIASQVTDITSRREYIHGTLWEASPLLGYCVVDTIPDANDKLTFLLITSAERKELLQKLRLRFGKSLDKPPKGEKLGSPLTVAYNLYQVLLADRKPKEARTR